MSSKAAGHNRTPAVAIAPCPDYSRGSVTAALRGAIGELGGIASFVRPGMRVLIKPNLCLPEPPEAALTTHPIVILELARMCAACGAAVTVGDSPVGRADLARRQLVFERTGVAGAAREGGYRCSFLDSGTKLFAVEVAGAVHRYLLVEEALSFDLLINVPKLKTHSLMTLTGAVKNLFGLVPDNSRRKLHSDLAERDDLAGLLTEIYRVTRPGLHIMDAVVGLEGDGPSLQGTPRRIGLILAATDGVALDAAAARLMGLAPDAIPTNRVARRAGLGETDVGRIALLGAPLERWIVPDFRLPATQLHDRRLTRTLFNLARTRVEVDEGRCSGCGLCADNCPVSAIRVSDGRARVDGQTCVECLMCHEMCPNAAITPVRALFYNQITGMQSRARNMR